MYLRVTLALALSALVGACTTDGGTLRVGSDTNFFDVVDSNGDGWVDIEEFRSQTLFPAYEQFFHEVDHDRDGRLDEYQFNIARSHIYNTMGIGGDMK